MGHLDDDAPDTFTVRIWWTEHSPSPEEFRGCTGVDMDDDSDVSFIDSAGAEHNCNAAAYEVIAE